MSNNKLFLSAIISTLLLGTACEQKLSNSAKADLSTKLDSVSYALGYQNGTFLAREGVQNLAMNNYNAGIQDGLSSEEGLLTQNEIYAVTNSYLQELNEKIQAENAAEGQAFLEENREKEGVMETNTGLQYKVIEEGNGDSPSASDVVRVHYSGKLIDGTYFDTSIKEIAQEEGLYNAQREPYEPAEFPLNRVIRGWTEGVQLMSEGATYEFFIPAELAYGANPPQGSKIKPNSTLIFRVELLEIKSGD